MLLITAKRRQTIVFIRMWKVTAEHTFDAPENIEGTMDAIITLRKQETCQVIIRNVPDDHRRPLSEWFELAMSARGKDWEEDDIEVDSFELVQPGSDDLPEVDFRPVETIG
jgi:hypothetical protein